jgi:acyl carrier protein
LGHCGAWRDASGECSGGEREDGSNVWLKDGVQYPLLQSEHQEDRQVASVEERVVEIVAEQLSVSKDQISRETSFVNDLGADSLDTVELVMELEEEFDINIPDDAAEKIQTVGQAIEHIEMAVAEKDKAS